MISTKLFSKTYWTSRLYYCFFNSITHWIAIHSENNYSGREAPSLKMGSVCFSYYYYYYYYYYYLEDLRSYADWLVRRQYLASSVIWRRTKCGNVLCFPWLHGLFVRTLMSRADADAGCGRPTLNFIERFELGSLRSDTVKPLHLVVSLGRKQQHRM